MTALTWKRHDSFEAEANGRTYYIHRVEGRYRIDVKIIGRRGGTRWVSLAVDTIEKAKQFCGKAYALHLKMVAA
jgi:hypothetical protein